MASHTCWSFSLIVVVAKCQQWESTIVQKGIWISVSQISMNLRFLASIAFFLVYSHSTCWFFSGKEKKNSGWCWPIINRFDILVIIAIASLKNIYHRTPHFRFAAHFHEWLDFLTFQIFNFKLMLVHILIYTGQRKFDMNANDMITYRALKGEERKSYTAIMPMMTEFYYTIWKRLKWMNCKICCLWLCLH